MRKLFSLAVVAGLFVALLAGPASADRPIEYDIQSVFDDVNVCTGAASEVTIDFHIKEHSHNNNTTILVIDSEASTDDGFSGFGHETSVFNDNVEVTTINFVMSNPETGQANTVKIHLTLFELGPPKVDNFTISCIKG
jgi:hypothetical protein